MTRPVPDNERFLSRWSRLKRAQRESAEAAGAETTQPLVSDPASSTVSVRAATAATDSASASASAQASLPSTDPATAPVSAQGARSTAIDGGAPAELPPIESLTMESDYAQFFQPKVPEALRRAAVKKLFADPHFNIMDGLDTYIDDYSKPDPLPPGMLARLWHARDIIDHPSDRKAEVEEGEAPSAAAPLAKAQNPAPAELDSRPRAGGDPATSDPDPPPEFENAVTSAESQGVRACAGTTSFLSQSESDCRPRAGGDPASSDPHPPPGLENAATSAESHSVRTCTGTTSSNDCIGTAAAAPVGPDKPPGTAA